MEESGTIRDAFKALGHDAWSCDIQPTRKPGQHIQGSVFDHDVVHAGWDLMVATRNAPSSPEARPDG